jgi:NAD(P)-dependent dehydrogenase (short-subunit alcohol dehydrogenase family)
LLTGPAPRAVFPGIKTCRFGVCGQVARRWLIQARSARQVSSPSRWGMPGDAGAEDLVAPVADIPLRRLGDAAEIGSAAVFLASDMSGYVTDAMLEVSGGRFM